MYCKYCGKEIADDSKFCSNCGKALNGQKSFVFKSKCVINCWTSSILIKLAAIFMAYGYL